jgi:hypothetical protein
LAGLARVHPEAGMLDFMQPKLTGRRLGGGGRKAGRNEAAPAGYADARTRRIQVGRWAAAVESVQHFCPFAKNCALASSRLDARPLVVMPRLGLRYTVIDQNHRSSGLL